MNNMSNASKFMLKEDFKRHFYIYDIEESQELVILFDEEKEYNNEIQRRLSSLRLNPLKHLRQLKCRIFVDNESFEPIILGSIFRGQNYVKVEEFNLRTKKGRGIGTLILDCLVEVLRNMEIERLDAPLSTVDYKKRKSYITFILRRIVFN
ncbi:hypothetical protein [Paenibacillus pinisoli]|uniref:hypothetical protein n=1 Tax=Paenibacillus pinisoli TaxID=1276110 RepID=UPI0010589034|nr:hypothetical protein [Paenibacillus pinisoli]